MRTTMTKTMKMTRMKRTSLLVLLNQPPLDVAVVVVVVAVV